MGYLLDSILEEHREEQKRKLVACYLADAISCVPQRITPSLRELLDKMDGDTQESSHRTAKDIKNQLVHDGGIRIKGTEK